jgi:peptidoglycan/LPS O-acetylase OafA/YrhL
MLRSVETSRLVEVCHLPREFASLTSLRFFAAVLIVLYHATEVADIGRRTGRGPLQTFVHTHVLLLRHAPLAVDFFFILSGFVLAHVYFQSLADREFDYRQFLTRRFARIYPLHAVTALVCLILFAVAQAMKISVADPRMFSAWSAAANLLMVHAWGVLDHLSLNGPSWAVSAEWAAYLAFPLLAWAVLKNPFGSLATFASTVLLFLGVYWCDTKPLLTERTFDFGTLRIAAEFPMGLALYRVFRERPTWVSHPALVWALVAMVLAAMQLQVEPCVVVLIFTLLIYSCAVTERACGIRGLTHPWFVYGGTISYSTLSERTGWRTPGW